MHILFLQENKWVKQNQKIPLPTSSSETHNAVRSAEEKLEVKKETVSENDETEIEESKWKNAQKMKTNISVFVC